jgi:hypothetical protein
MLKCLRRIRSKHCPHGRRRHLVDGCHALGLPVRGRCERQRLAQRHLDHRRCHEAGCRSDLGSIRHIQEVRLIPAHPRDYPDRFGFGFPLRFKVEADDRTLFDSTSADFPNPGDTPVAFPTPGLRAQAIRITATSAVGAQR